MHFIVRNCLSKRNRHLLHSKAVTRFYEPSFFPKLEISGLERSRSVMSEELVRLTNENDEMDEKVTEIPKLKVQLKELEQRHNTILQMYGEKAEEAEELRLDLEDVKNMYKLQIDELLKNQK